MAVVEQDDAPVPDADDRGALDRAVGRVDDRPPGEHEQVELRRADVEVLPVDAAHPAPPVGVRRARPPR